MACFTKGRKANKKKLPAFKFELPELQQDEADVPYVYLRALTGTEVRQHLAGRPAAGEGKPGDKPPATDYEILALCVLDDSREPIFTDAGDVEANLDVGAHSQQAMVRKILELSDLKIDRSPN